LSATPAPGRSGRHSGSPRWLRDHWFLLSLAGLLPVGIFGAEPLGVLTAVAWPRTLLVVVVMGMMALPIPLELVRRALARPWPAVLASLINMALMPLLAWVVSPTLPPYLAGGLIVATAIPCTLASAAVWTRRAGGDDTVAVLVTLITNVASVVVTPFWLVVYLRRTVELDVWGMIAELFLVVLLPMAVAQGLRCERRVAAWAERHKGGLSVACQVGILVMVFLGAIEMGRQWSRSAGGAETPWWSVVWLLALAGGVHVAGLAAGWRLAAATGVARPQRIGVAISGSQKTLMVGLKLALDCGVSILPMVAYHVGQLLIDALIADRWRRAGEAEPGPKPE
jgi:solute carrier family 10 (sodium/bile acid cotransporter), member 7